MKNKGLIFLATACLALSSSLTRADIVFHLAGANSCSNLSGNWNGNGAITAMGGMINCKYTGIASITVLGDPHLFTMQIDLNRQTGLCPAKEDFTLSGSCHDGVIVITTTSTHLSGNLNDAGTVAALTGTVTINIPKMGDIVADVKEMNMYKALV